MSIGSIRNIRKVCDMGVVFILMSVGMGVGMSIMVTGCTMESTFSENLGNEHTSNNEQTNNSVEHKQQRTNLPDCSRYCVSGIRVGATLYENRSFWQQRQLKRLINSVLKQDIDALAKLIRFDCGGGAGCYDLGIILADIVYTIGEASFVSMVTELSDDDKTMLAALLQAGLEYGGYRQYAQQYSQQTPQQASQQFSQASQESPQQEPQQPLRLADAFADLHRILAD